MHKILRRKECIEVWLRASAALGLYLALAFAVSAVCFYFGPEIVR